MSVVTGQQSNTEHNSNVNWEPWIQTYSGVKFHYLSGKPEEVVSEDLCTVLSRIPRWTGHTNRFYSVGQHLVLTSILVKERGGTEEEQLQGILHDAPEGYMMDLASPLKKLIPRYKEIENKVWRKVSKRYFGKAIDICPLVKDCDSTMLATEARDLFTFPPLDNWVRRCPPPWERKIDPVGPIAAYNLFKARLEELTHEKF